MINPLRKKTREHAEKMGLLDMAKKVEELAEMVNILTTAHKRTVEERLEDKGIVKSEGGGGVWYGYKNKYGYGDNSRVINKVILDPEDMIAIETNRYMKKKVVKKLKPLQSWEEEMYKHFSIMEKYGTLRNADSLATTREVFRKYIRTNFIPKTEIKEAVEEMIEDWAGAKDAPFLSNLLNRLEI
ncbi:MAG: hypothetical protein DRP97_00470 [Candidatus Latescibacterota bacterium]|nr:MAG: hypothetical protein DRP97_00470 [Candidatus Latescibacterota bacterium]